MNCLEVIKNNSAFKLIEADIAQGVMSHSYMVVGNDAYVIEEFIRAVEMLVYCESHSACMHCAACRMVLDNNNANIYKVEAANGKEIKVDEITAMIEDTYIAPYDNGYKVYSICRGEMLSVASQNKLLKTLEEPIGKKLMLIGTTNESNMLDTIKSRCKKLYIQPFTLDEVLSILGEDVDRQTAERAYKIAGGRLSVIKEMLGDDSNLESEYNSVVNMLIALKSSRDLPRVVGMIEGKINGDSVRHFLDILEVVLRDTMRGDNESLRGVGFNMRSIANIGDLIITARQKLYFNCGATAVLDYVLFGILEVKYKCR